MSVKDEIKNYIARQPEPKRRDMQVLHDFILKILPTSRLWFFDGKNSENKIVSNPNIGYGLYTIKYADGTSRDFYQIGLSANTTGISVYIMGLKDKAFLAQTFGKRLGKTGVTAYCIKLKTLKDIHLNVLEEAILYGVKETGLP